MSDQPRTEAGRALLAGHYPSGVPFKEQMREYLSRSILDIEREAAARPLDGEALDWDYVGALISDALDYTNDGAVIAKAIRDYLAAPVASETPRPGPSCTAADPHPQCRFAYGPNAGKFRPWHCYVARPHGEQTP